MQIGIVGLPNVGKSTLFNALTKNYSADAANFPFCTIEPNIGIVDVKDKRVDILSDLSHSEKKIYSAIKFVDIAWLVKGASQGEGLGNQFLATIREVDAIVQVVRHFEDDDVVHVEGSTDPLRDVEIINTELMLADLQSIEKILPDLERKLKWHDTETQKLVVVMKKMRDYLAAWKLAWDISDDLTTEEKNLLKPYNFLTYKPFIYALNVSESELKNAIALQQEYMQKLGKPVSVVCAKFESEIMDLDAEEKEMFLQEIQWWSSTPIPTLDDLIKLAFDTVGLMYYFTTGEKETRAWTVNKGSTAPQAAGAIHTDFQRGFIKAEVVGYAHFAEAWSWSKAREKGYLRLEGKDYIVQDGDVMVFKFNV